MKDRDFWRRFGSRAVHQLGVTTVAEASFPPESRDTFKTRSAVPILSGFTISIRIAGADASPSRKTLSKMSIWPACAGDADFAKRTFPWATGAWHHAVGFPKFYSRSHDAVIRVYDDAGNVIETHEHAGGFRECELCARVWQFRLAVSLGPDNDELVLSFHRGRLVEL
jgi:hypothetical protein